MPNQHTRKFEDSIARLNAVPIRLSAAERIELAAGAVALGETISATLRAGGLARARKALRAVRA
jgi:hypothetical protein